jgi:putative endonuclease
MWYYGHTDNLERRLLEHNTGQNKSTKNKGPWEVIFVRGFETKIEANRFELKLKKLKNKRYIRKEYSEYFI